MRKKLFTLFVLLSLSSSLIYAQGQTFARSTQIDPPTMFGSGFGTTVSGVDLDGDGKVEIYSVNGMSDYNNGDEYPQIIKYENNGGSWDSVWAASFPEERQNTWAALTVGDLDGDGKQEIIWGYTNSFGTNVTPPRIVVFESNGDDLLGISDGSGNFIPNTSWDMDVPASTNMRPLKWKAFDIDSDGKEEVIFAERRDFYNFGIISVSDVPDGGSGSEVWTMEFNATTELYNQFVRSAQVDPSEIGFPGGVGDVLSGVDIDKDGLMDAYVINDNTNDTFDDELRPKLMKLELVNGAWVPRWESDLGDIIPKQNTWPKLKYADLDNDGKEEVVWLIVNNLGGDPAPSRIAVYEAAGDSSDVMGIDDGSGNLMPNSLWNMGVPEGVEMRPQNVEIFDIDGDGVDEVLFSERKDYYLWGVVSVDDIPDAGDGTETWTVEAAGTGAGTGGSVYSDMAVMNGNMYVLDWNGDITKVSYTGGAYTSSIIQSGVPLWSFKSMQTVDIDGDGTEEIIAANYSTGGQIFLFTEDVDTLAINQIGNGSNIGITRAPGGGAGDIDNDGMLDYIIGGRGTDVIGRLEYQGGPITDSASYQLTILDQGSAPGPGLGNFEIIHLFNIDGDASDEVFYTSAYQRGLDNGVTYPLVVGHYSDTLKADAGRRWDMTIANGAAHFFNGSGDIQSVYFEDGSYKVTQSQPGVVNGAFLTASPYDVNGDGVEEIFVANWYDAKVTLLTWKFGFWTSTEIYDFTDVGGNRLNGGAVGDLDNDGFVDFVFGSRQSTPNAQIYRVEYKGGELKDMNNWRGEVIDQELMATHTQYEVVNLENLDDDPELEVLYTSDYARGPNTGSDPQVPIVILNVNIVESTPIADIKVDGDGNFVPDNMGLEYTVQAVVTSPDYQGTRLEIYVQDATAGIQISSSNDSGMVFNVGDLLQITGTVGQYKGMTQLGVADPTADIIVLGQGTVPEPKKLSVEEWLENAEMYEGSLIKFNGLTKVEGDWPGGVSFGNFVFSNGVTEFTFRVDSDTDIDENIEPVYPINSVGISGQYTNADPANNGYQLLPRFYTDIAQDVHVPPNPNFALLSPGDGVEITIADSADTWDFVWNHAVDLNNDAILYQWFVVGDAFVSGPLTDTMYTISAMDVMGAMSGADSLSIQWSVRAKGAEQDFVASVDTFTVTFINLLVGVEETIPNRFFVDQNYPNPFNPSTTIRFGLPEQMKVDLRIYDILGRQVATLVNSETLGAGTYTFNFNASSLASGTYIYRLSTDNKVITKKMLLLK